MSMILVMAAIHTFKDVQSDDALFAHAQQVKNMVSQLGIASGSALAAVGLQWRIAHHYASLNMNFVVGNDAFAGTLAASTAQWAQQVGANVTSQLALAQAAQALLQQSTLLATFDYFIGVMLIGLLGAAIMTVQKTLK
jgi:MFS transporter, DHA2 family, multidrug resistance protein